MKPVLTILRGVSGSGKTTWVKKQDWDFVCVSRDKLRLCLFDTEDFIDEGLVTRIEDFIIRESLITGHNVIVDDTNVNFKYVQRLANIAYRLDLEVKIHTIDVTFADAIIRNLGRSQSGGRNVPNDVIKRQYDMLEESKKMTPIDMWAKT